MKNTFSAFFGVVLFSIMVVCLTACLNPLNFDMDKVLGEVGVSLTVSVKNDNDTAAALILANKSKTTDVTKVTITRDAIQGETKNMNTGFENQPKRLTKKAQYLIPTDKPYTVTVDYAYYNLNNPGDLEGTGTKTFNVLLPVERMIEELSIFRDVNGNVVIVDSKNNNMDITDPNRNPQPHPDDTGIPVDDPLAGEGSSPAIIKLQSRDYLAPFIVRSMTNRVAIESVTFAKESKIYTMGGIAPKDMQTIALGEGKWEITATYLKDDVPVIVGPENAIVNPNTNTAHSLYFYLTNRGDYGISLTWPPYPNDADDSELLPPDVNGRGRGLIKITNNSYAMVTGITIQNLSSVNVFPIYIDCDQFAPNIPVQFQKTGYVDVIGTDDFPIEAGPHYLVQVTIDDGTDDTSIVERRVYLKDQVANVLIENTDIQEGSRKGALFQIKNKTSYATEIINMEIINRADDNQRNNYTIDSWTPAGSIIKDKEAQQHVFSSISMPILQNALYRAEVTLYGAGMTETVNIDFFPADLYSAAEPSSNIRIIEVKDEHLSSAFIEALTGGGGGGGTERGATITINNTSNWPVEVTSIKIQNTVTASQNVTFAASSFDPAVPVASGKNGKVKVVSSAAMPITASATFKATVTIAGGGMEITREKTFTPQTLYNATGTVAGNIRTITIVDTDVPDEMRNAIEASNRLGAAIKLYNMTGTGDYEVYAMRIFNNSRPAESYTYNAGTWNPHKVLKKGEGATQMVYSTDLPIRRNETYTVEITWYANLRYGITIKGTNYKLYSTDTPENNEIEIFLNDADVSAAVKTLAQYDKPDPKKVTVRVYNRTKDYPVELIGIRTEYKIGVTTTSLFRISSNHFLPNCANLGPGNYPYGNDMYFDIVSSNVQRISEYMDQSFNPNIPQGRGTAESIVSFYLEVVGKGKTGEIQERHTKNAQGVVTFSPIDLWLEQDNGREIVFYIYDDDVPANIKAAIDSPDNSGRGARFIVRNEVTSYPSEITSVKITSIVNSRSQILNSSTWSPGTSITNGKSASQTVLSTGSFPIKPDMTNIRIDITVLVAGQTHTLPARTEPTLYSDLSPDENIRYIRITNDNVKNFIPNTGTALMREIDNAAIGDVILIDGHEWVKAREGYTGYFPQNKCVMLVYRKTLTETIAWNTKKMVTSTVFPNSENPPLMYWNPNFYDLNYYDIVYLGSYFTGPSAMDKVNNWYRDLVSPELKKIHLYLKKVDSPWTLNEYVDMGFLMHGLYVSNNGGSGQWNGKGDFVSKPTLTVDLVRPQDYANFDYKEKVIAFIPSYADLKELRDVNRNYVNGYSWWLRDIVVNRVTPTTWQQIWGAMPINEHKYIVYVQPDGKLNYKSYTGKSGVRPALWVRVD